LVMGLRLAEGLERARVDHAIDKAAVDRLAALGLMERTIDRVRVTPAGMLLLDAVLAEVAL